MFYYVPKRLRAKLDLRFRIGVFLGNSQNSNEAFIGIGNGNVIKSRSVVRVVASQRWSKEAISKIVGIPGRLTPQGIEDIGPNIEEVVDPHANKDEAIGIDDDDGADLIDDRSMQQIDRQIRITLKDCQRFGFTEGCHRCLDLEAGAYRTNSHHNDNCRLRMYLAFRDANTAKWREVRHMVEPEPDGKFHRNHVDPEGQPRSSTP